MPVKAGNDRVPIWSVDQRYYDAGSGSFWSADPLDVRGADPKNPTSWNRYAFAHNDPVNGSDPSGLLVFDPPSAQDCINNPDNPYCGDPCMPLTEALLDAPLPGCGGPPEPMPPPGGGGGGGPDCNAITAAVGFAGLDYNEATEVWDDLANTKGINSTAVAALGVVTWAGESSFAVHPTNNGNDNGSVDIGPFQLNYPLWKSAVPSKQWNSVFGTNVAAGQTFNGDPDANITVGLKYLNYLYGKFGDQAAGLYTGRHNPNRAKRQSTFEVWGSKLENLFSDTDCFPKRL